MESEEISFVFDRTRPTNDPYIQSISTSNAYEMFTLQEPHDELEVHNMVAEFMLLANQSVAEQIWKVFPACALLRHHPAPQPRKFQALVQVCFCLCAA